MDPYLEAHWGDVHARFIAYASDQLQSKLPSDLRARVQERVFDIQTLIDQCYHNGRYDDLDYAADPSPPLTSPSGQTNCSNRAACDNDPNPV